MHSLLRIIASNGKMVGEWWIGKGFEGNFCALVDILLWLVSERTEQEKIIQCRVSNCLNTIKKWKIVSKSTFSPKTIRWIFAGILYCHVPGVPWLIITDSGLDVWINWHLQSHLITINYNNSTQWLPKTRSIPCWTRSVFSSIVIDLILIYESVTSSTKNLT
jgi:hypothetical protein